MSKIEWVNKGVTVNPFVGCGPYPASVGCERCYAARFANRLQAQGLPQYQGVVENGKWTGKINYWPQALDGLGKLKFGTRVFVCSMSDIFHENIPADKITEAFDIMYYRYPHLLFLLLTKRPERIEPVMFGEEGRWYLGAGDYYPNIWIGFTAENQMMMDKRWPVFCDALGPENFTTYASLEPLLGPVNLLEPVLTPGVHPEKVNWCKKLDWVIVGGETGAGFRICPHDPKADIEDWFTWARYIRDQCKAQGIPFFFKKPPGRTHKMDADGFTVDTPQDLRIREFPKYEHLLERKK
jgi:protein gp37